MKKTIIGILIGVVLGFGGFMVYDKLLSEPKEVKSEEKKEETSNQNVSYKPNSPANVANKDDYVDITSKVAGLNIKIEDDEYLEFLIGSFDYDANIDDKIIGGFYEENISDDVKLASVLSDVIGEFSNVSYDDWAELEGPVKIENKTIVSLASQVFTDFKFENVKGNWTAYNISNVLCDNDYCYFSYHVFGIEGPTDEYEPNLSQLKVNSDGTKTITAKPVYVEYDYNEDNDYVTITVSEKKNGKILKKYSDCILDEEEKETKKYCFDFNGYDVKQYTYTFSKDNKLVSVKVS